jgi:hypothetical protein
MFDRYRIGSNGNKTMAKSDLSAASNGNTWESLKKAIVKSSGFLRWQEAKDFKGSVSDEERVRLYLRETLQTLAY